MIRNVLTIALASGAMIAAGPLSAKPGGGGPSAGATTGTNTHVGAGAGQAGTNARVNSQGSINASPNGMLNSNANSAVRNSTTTNVTPNTTPNATKSQGLQNASPTGIAHASPRSVLARGAVAATDLPGLTTGMTVNNSAGTSIGTVSQVVTGADGSIRLVIVTSPTGQTIRLAPSTLSISGGVVTTTGG